MIAPMCRTVRERRRCAGRVDTGCPPRSLPPPPLWLLLLLLLLLWERSPSPGGGRAGEVVR